VLDTITSIGALRDGVQFLSPFSMQRFTISRHLVHGPISELFYLFLPLVLLTRVVWQVRGIPWLRRAVDEPASITERQTKGASDVVRGV
jgi:hypothetical protein